MAKKLPPADPQMWIVSISGVEETWEAEATTEAEAIAKVIAENELKRDARNFRATPANKPAGLSAPIPKLSK